MATIALFHSVLGVRDGVRVAARRLTEDGHTVSVVDQYDGKTFDDYDEASAFAEGIGYPELMASAADAIWTTGSSLRGSPTAAACPSTLQPLDRSVVS